MTTFAFEQEVNTNNPIRDVKTKYIVTANWIGAKCFHGPSAHFVFITWKLIPDIIKDARPKSRYISTVIIPINFRVDFDIVSNILILYFLLNTSMKINNKKIILKSHLLNKGYVFFFRCFINSIGAFSNASGTINEFYEIFLF